jgi:hypothetical protein
MVLYALYKDKKVNKRKEKNMKYFCEKCRIYFDEEEIISSSEYGMDIAMCPECHRELQECKECKICHNSFAEEERKVEDGVCEECLHSEDDNIDFWYGICSASGQVEDVSLNAVLTTAFTEDEMEEILLEELKKRHKENPEEYNCSRFVNDDTSWAAEQLKENY